MMDMSTPVMLDEPGSTWHAGEVALQRQAGVADRMKDLGRRVVRDYMPDQHRAFFAQLPFVALGSVDADGDAWATLVAGKPGFVQSPDPHRLRVNAMPEPRDPAAAGVREGAAVALLGIELHTRRRNRMNGIVRELDAGGFAVDVGQSFGNCPQYIQIRNFTFTREPSVTSDAAPIISNELTGRAREIIAAADTFFVASYADRGADANSGANGGANGNADNVDGHAAAASRREVDVSHRGGNTGFVRIGADGVLTIPDFAGNLFFATLGNIVVNGRAGLVFVDFATGDLLQITGDASVDTDSPEVAAFQGAERLWRVKPRRVVYRPRALPLRWVFNEDGWSLNSLMTGNWTEAEHRLQAAALADAWRPFKVAQIVDESTTIRSFHLEPADGAGVIPHEAGQHLPIRVALPDETGAPGAVKTVRRTYTISSGPADGGYRISVKREGVVSRYLHDTLRVGSVIEARAPAGRFTIDAQEERPAVLLAAGVGITPMIAMLRHIVYEGLRTRHMRPTWLFQSARTLHERAFTDEVDYLASVSGGAVEIVRTLSDPQGARRGKDFDQSGRLDIALLRETLPLDDYDFYLCGPAGFMQSLYDGLRKLNIADERIHAEAFGPSGLKRTREGTVTGTAAAATAPSAPSAPAVQHVPAAQPTPVVFAKSGKEAQWNPASGSLLELAEAQGLSPEFSCRGGTCGSCRTRIVDGVVAYASPPEFPVGENEALICCAVPARTDQAGGGEPLVLDL
jgi:ferredoxin-NADP reductase/predicted pyridoxine 5'-phosphate oxidase superfamily flavin-nucleotide-binding protein